MVQSIPYENPLIGIKQGQDYVTGLFDQRAQMDAGGLFAKGDLEGAAGLVAQRGDIPGAQKILGEGERRVQNQRVQREQEIKDRATWLGHAADALSQIPQDEGSATRKKAFVDHIAPTMKAMGVSDDVIGQLGNGDLSDENLKSFKALLGQQLSKFEKVGNSIVEITPTGGVNERYAAPQDNKVVGNSLVDPTGKPLYTEPKTEYRTVTNADGTSSVVALNGGATGGGQTTTAPSGEVYDKISSIASAQGGKPDEVSYLQRLAQVESNGDGTAKNGSSTGTYQFHPDTFASVGGKDINDLGDQTKAALALSRRDRGILQAAGVEPTDANLYIMHQQGAGGGQALLTAPPAVNAIAVLTPVYGSEAKAKAAIVGNGGNPNMTAGEFVDYWHKRWSKAPATAAGPAGKVVATGSNDGGSGGLDEDAINYVAEQYVITGQLPTLGAGKAAAQAKEEIITRAAAIEKETGRTGKDAVLAHMQIKSAQSNLSAITKTLSSVSASEATVLKNAEYALSLAPKGGGPTGSPMLNTPIQQMREKVWGSDQVSAFNNAIGTVADEYAKVMTSSTGTGGGSTEGSRQEAYSRLSKSATFAQLQSNIAAMRVEMKNRTDSLRKEQDGIKASILSVRGGGGTTPAQPVEGDFTPAQRQAASTLKMDKSAPVGQQSHPFAPRSEAEYNGLKPGSWYIRHDGQLVRKGG